MSSSSDPTRPRWFGRFNIYDVFSSFLPGAVFLIGLVPIFTSEIADLNVPLPLILVFIIFAFLWGFVIQTIGSTSADTDDIFDEHMAAIVDYSQESPLNVTEMDYIFLADIRRELELSIQFDDWDRLFKYILSYLEGTSRDRAIRLQALFLMTRGCSISAGSLTGLYVLWAAAAYDGILSPPFSFKQYLLIAIPPAIAAIYLRKRQNEFEKDMVMYMINEFHLEKNV